MGEDVQDDFPGAEPVCDFELTPILTHLLSCKNVPASKMARRLRSHPDLPQMFGRGQDDFPAAEPVCDFELSPRIRTLSTLHTTSNLLLLPKWPDD